MWDDNIIIINSGLSTAGALAGGASDIADVTIDKKASDAAKAEAECHNREERSTHGVCPVHESEAAGSVSRLISRFLHFPTSFTV